MMTGQVEQRGCSGRGGFVGRFARLGVTSIAVLAATLTVTGTSQAAISYGNFAGTTVDYINVSEDNQNLFGNPTVTGDTITFSPLGFEAMSSGVMPPQLVDGTVGMVIDAKPGFGIEEFELTEAGAFSLVGVGTAATRVVVSVTAIINILEVDGSAVAPVLVSDSATLADFNRVAQGENFGTPWSGTFTVDVAGLAAAEGITGDITRISIVIDNTLVAMSEASTTSFIDKKAINGMTITVPEPASVALAGAALLLLARRRAA